MEYYIVFRIYFYGEQGWDCWAECVTSNLSLAVDKANSILQKIRESETGYYKWNKDRFGVCVLPVIDGEDFKNPERNCNAHTYSANTDEWFSVGDFY